MQNLNLKGKIVGDIIYLETGGLKVPEEFGTGCSRPEIKKEVDRAKQNGKAKEPKEEVRVNQVESKGEMQMIKVGKAAPGFTAPGFFKGKFMNFSLEEYKGKWVVVCFYPGDFTFV